MSKKVSFSIQCKLQNGNRFLVSWIPEKYAIRGKYLKIKDRQTDKWEDGWQVLDVGVKMPYEFIVNRSEDHKKMKEVSDV